MLTSRAQSGDKVFALEAGVQDFLTKPFAPASLTQSIRRQLRRRRLLADDKAGVAAVAPPRTTANAEAPGLAEFVESRKSPKSGAAYDDAAGAYTRAFELAASPDVGNKSLRPAGKMYVLLAESATDPSDIRRGYTQAARAFLSAGNITAATSANRSAKEAVGPDS